MKTFSDMLGVLVEFNKSIPKLVREAVENNEDSIISLNADEQLYELGITATGISINSFAPYKLFTYRNKIASSQPADRVTLRDRGEFHQDFFLNTSDTSFTISSHDEKTADLTMKYGDDIFGLTEENKAFVSKEYVYPELINLLRRTL